MTTSKIALLDSNILVYAADTTSPYHQESRDLRKRGLKGELILSVCPQVLSEFYAVITDKKRVNDPRTREEALLEIEKYMNSRNIFKIYPSTETMKNMVDLIKQHQITKQRIFDLQLVATILSNNINSIYTYNQEHFSEFEEIQVLTP